MVGGFNPPLRDTRPKIMYFLYYFFCEAAFYNGSAIKEGGG